MIRNSEAMDRSKTPMQISQITLNQSLLSAKGVSNCFDIKTNQLPRCVSSEQTHEIQIKSPCCIHPKAECKIKLPAPPKCPEGTLVHRVLPIKPNDHKPSSVPFEGVTTYQSQYYSKCGRKASKIVHVPTLVPLSGVIDKITSYRYEFTPKVVHVEKGYKPKPSPKQITAPMRKVTQYKYDFRQVAGSKVTSIIPQEETKLRTGKLNTVTTYKAAYAPYVELLGRKIEKGPQDALGYEFLAKTFEFATTYKTAYNLNLKSVPKVMLIKPVPRNVLRKGKLEAASVYRKDYAPFHFGKCSMVNKLYSRDLYASGCENE